MGAGKRVYIDHDPRRRERRAMIEDLRGDEIVRVLYIRDLGGSPVADKLWIARIEKLGCEVQECRPEKPVRPAHRPREFDPTPEQDKRIRAVWLDENRSLQDRCQAVTDILGGRVRRQRLYARYGKPGAPK